LFDAIIVDLDGTVVDCAARHYACYVDVSKRLGIACLDANTYWTMKRRRVPWSKIASEAGVKADSERLEHEFVASIEDPAYLKLDTVYSGASSALASLRQITSVVILTTMRRQAIRLERQLADLGIATLFDRVSCRGTSDVVSKAVIARDALPAGAGTLAWIGDTEEDVTGARALGATAWAVHGGMRDREYLERCKPDLLCENLPALVRQIEQSKSDRIRSSTQR